MIPAQYMSAREDFERFLYAARDESGLVSINQTYTMVEGVFRAFRRRLALREAILFSNVLPPGIRMLFVADWDPDERRGAFEDREAMTVEARGLRELHNFAPATCIHDTAFALRQCVNEARLDAVLAELPPGAHEFWTP